MAAQLGGEHLEPLYAVAEHAGLDLEAALGGSDDQLRPTQVAQPALLAVEVALLASLPPGVEVVGVAGHSVGEYAAAVAGGAMTPEVALELVVERGRAMAASRRGTMSALIGLDAGVVQEICADVQQSGAGVVVVANLNAPGQTVVSGEVAAVEAVEALARERGCRRSVRLNVSGAFHSPLMSDAAAQFSTSLEAAHIDTARIPIVCNVDALAVTDPEALRSRLARQLVSPVRWTECVEELVALGAEMLVEVGPASVLTGLAKRIVPGVSAIAVGAPREMRELAAMTGAAT
jgi:[acyl-carrier-protein] S-malonyltransferase